jgi:hypothetical protein
MPRVLLTERFIREVAPVAHGRGEYQDALCPQLRLRVYPTGRKSFCLMTRYPGHANPTRRLLGQHFGGNRSILAAPDCEVLERPRAALTLPEPRRKARQWLAQIARGIDPGVAIKAARAARAARAVPKIILSSR